MKTKVIVFLLCVLLICGVCVLDFSICRHNYKKNQEQAEEVLRIAHKMVDVEVDDETLDSMNDYNDDNNKNVNNDVLGILCIQKLNLEAPVKEGTSQDVMKTCVGHFEESDFWNGNVSFASHNSGTSMHYFQYINTLQVNDEIKYKTKLGERVYKVQSVEKISDTDWSKVVGNGECGDVGNTITLITCINGQPDYRLCVRGVEV